MRVLVTRGAWPTLAAALAGTPIELQFSETTVQADPVDRRPGDEVIARLADHDWLVVTSARGATALRRRLAESAAPALPTALRVATIGPATAAALAELGAPVDLVARESSSDGLIAALVPRLTRGERVVLVRPEGTPGAIASALRAAGALVSEAPLYRTMPSESAPALADAAIGGAFAAVVFSAPSSLTLWLDAAGTRRPELVAALKRMRRVAIGPTTSARMSALNVPADAVAESPSAPAVAAALASALGIDLLR